MNFSIGTDAALLGLLGVALSFVAWMGRQLWNEVVLGNGSSEQHSRTTGEVVLEVHKRVTNIDGKVDDLGKLAEGNKEKLNKQGEAIRYLVGDLQDEDDLDVDVPDNLIP